jgi:hypothetical protein
MLKHSFFFPALAVGLSAQQPPAIRLISAPDVQSKHVLGFVAAVRELPDGRLLVNDIQHRQLLLFDQTLGTAHVLADSVEGGASSYGPAPGSLVPYRGDSTLFIDPRDLSMLVIDPKGAIARVAAVPRSQDAGFLGSNVIGSPGFDAKGRLVYRAGFGRLGPPINNKGLFTPPDFPDSAAIVRVDLATRKVDTAAFYKIPKQKINVTQTDRGFVASTEMNPMPVIDDWTVLADGTIAVVRGRDYHVDWIDGDGAVTPSPKMPFPWQRLSDDDKVAVIDSARAAMEAVRAKMAAGGTPAMAAGGNVVIIGGEGRGGVGGGGNMPAFAFVSPSELPDYRPAIIAGSAKADLDDNLWIRTSAVRPGAIGGPIYDVVDRKGVIVDRVQVPAGRQIVGFGKGGVVYMVARDDQGAWLERAKR